MPGLAWHAERWPAVGDTDRRVVWAHWSIDGELPALVGTPRQVAWANRIRRDQLAALLKWMLDVVQELIAYERRHPDYSCPWPRETWDDLATRAWGDVLDTAEASWWIDRRGWWAGDLRLPDAGRDEAGALQSWRDARRAEAVTRHLLQLDAERDLDPAEAIEVAIDGVLLGGMTESGAPPRFVARLGITPAGTLHQRWPRGWSRKPVEVKWDGSMDLRDGRFLPARGELDRIGIGWW